MTSPFDQWIRALEVRHLADLQFREVTRALRALSSAYVERRETLPRGAALSGAGKRAAFALFYGPLHYLLVHSIVREIPGATSVEGPLADLGCGTGAAGAGWVAACPRSASLVGVDRHPWAVSETTWTYCELGLQGRARMGDIGRDTLPRGRAFLAAFALNELAVDVRASVLTRLHEQATRGHAVLIVEPLAKAVAPWWNRAIEPFLQAGGRADEWRFRVRLPPLVEKLDRAAGLNHQEITGRSLWMPPG